MGEVAFPLVPAQAREIIARAEAAPLGRGNKTVYDESVRKSWQLDAADFTFAAKAWKSFLKRALDHIAATLGIRGKISALPYKFLLYGPGGRFKAHKDAEKLDAMFGTLVIALPSKHEGGQLHIRHDGREHTVEFGRPEHARDIQYAAFFADCEHEVVPVTAGYRCCAIYNLRPDEGDPSLLNLSLTAQSRPLLRTLAEQWCQILGTGPQRGGQRFPRSQMPLIFLCRNDHHSRFPMLGYRLRPLRDHCFHQFTKAALCLL